MTAIKHWRNDRGVVVLTLHDNGSLVKFEKAKDRLRAMSYMGHAVDKDAFDEGVELGATTLWISEDGGRIVWEGKIEDVLSRSRIITIYGTARRAFDLRYFKINQGLENAPSWYTEAARPAPAVKEEPKQEQLGLFGLTVHERRFQRE
jgi:hypothetical protein